MNWKDKFNLDKAGYTNEYRQKRSHYYTDVLHGKKNAFGKVYEVLASDFVDIVGAPVENDITKKMDTLFKNKNYKWNLPYYHVGAGRLKGLHRVNACMKNGMKRVPVLFVADCEDTIKEWFKDRKWRTRAVN